MTEPPRAPRRALLYVEPGLRVPVEPDEVFLLEARRRRDGVCSAVSARTSPLLVIVAAPNGAGKSTTAPELLQDALAVEETSSPTAESLPGLCAVEVSASTLERD